jgi:serine/alanine adding enzyme
MLNDIIIEKYNEDDMKEWDDFVNGHPNGTVSHLSEWKEIIETTYNLESYYFIAKIGAKIVGVLPLFLIKSYIFGSELTSMPFLSTGGILANSFDIYDKILNHALLLITELKIQSLEFRCINQSEAQNSLQNFKIVENTSKVRMVLSLGNSAEQQFNSFKYNLRRKINKPRKEGMYFKVGGIDLLSDFYKIFAQNMRDLGSPVHPINFFKAILNHLEKIANIGVVYLNQKPLAAGLIFRYRDTIETPWISSLRKIKNYHNIFLYWSFIELACESGIKYFDFGRSTVDEGTYKFKAQWGATRITLHWFKIFPNSSNNTSTHTNKNSFIGKVFIGTWKHLPLPVANYFGPRLRRFISL